MSAAYLNRGPLAYFAVGLLAFDDILNPLEGHRMLELDVSLDMAILGLSSLLDLADEVFEGKRLVAIDIMHKADILGGGKAPGT